MYRDLHPTNWWWTPEIDFAAATLFALQVANWQRGGGKGSKPKPVKKPRDAAAGTGVPKTLDELEAKRKAHHDVMKRRQEVIGGN